MTGTPGNEGAKAPPFTLENAVPHPCLATADVLCVDRSDAVHDATVLFPGSPICGRGRTLTESPDEYRMTSDALVLHVEDGLYLEDIGGELHLMDGTMD